MTLTIPKRLAENCRPWPERAAWLEQLPGVIRDLAERWSLTLEAPFDGDEGGAAWVAPSVRADGTSVVLLFPYATEDSGWQS